MTEDDQRPTEDRRRWDDQVARLVTEDAGAARRRVPLSAERVVETALALVRAHGYEQVTMRRVAEALGSSPGALYVHVRDKRELDDLMLGSLCGRIELPTPDASRWREQAVTVCAQLRDLYLEHPGLSRIALGAAPRSVDTLRLFEGLLALLSAGGVGLTRAAWTVDAAFAYTAAYGVVSLRRAGSGPAGSERRETVERFEMLPPTLFPIVSRHAEEITAGEGHERFDFTLGLLFGSLAVELE